MADLYQVLGVDKTATQDEIKKSYRKLAHQFHPDKTSGDKSLETKFKEVNNAYEVLGDPKKRATYDQFGEVVINANIFSSFFVNFVKIIFWFFF